MHKMKRGTLKSGRSGNSTLYLARRLDDPNTHLRAICEMLGTTGLPQHVLPHQHGECGRLSALSRNGVARFPLARALGWAARSPSNPCHERAHA
jgi:hypothetical protein